MSEDEVKPAPRPAYTFTVSGILASIAVIAIAATCVRLGFWQLDRLAQRRERNEQIQARLERGPVAAAAALRDTVGLGYRAIQLTGTFDDDRSIVLPGRAYRGSPGVHLLTPLRLDGREIAVLVNRGWVPAADAASIDIETFGTDVAHRTLRGLIMPFPGRRASIGAQADRAPAEPTFRRVWFTIDEARLRAQFPYPIADFVVHTLPEARPPAAGTPPYPLPLEPPPLDQGPHLGYAIQWFSFAAIAIIGWLTLARRRTAASPARPAAANAP